MLEKGSMKEEAGLEQQYMVKLYVKLGKSASETFPSYPQLSNLHHLTQH